MSRELKYLLVAEQLQIKSKAVTCVSCKIVDTENSENVYAAAIVHFL
jgi:hypothetical protein